MSTDSFTTLLQNVRSNINEISAGEAQDMAKKGAILIDVREESEYDAEIIPNAITPGRSHLEQYIFNNLDAEKSSIILYCGTGLRSALAVNSLKGTEYVNIYSLAGGIASWKEHGFKTQVRRGGLTQEERKRYSRQLILPSVGQEGQLKLKNSKVLVVGAGGLGSSCLTYLAAAGVGTLGVIDGDTVDLGNLQRQTLYSVSDLGRPKVAAAKGFLTALNGEITVDEIPGRLNSVNALEIFSKFDLVIDCTDNFTARYLINDTAIVAQKPVVHGAVFQFEGEVAVFNKDGSACYRCVYPEAPPNEIAPSCSEAGVIGVVPGLIGLLQAGETIKIILGIGTVATNSSLIVNFMDGSVEKRNFARRKECRCNQPRLEPIHHA